MHSTGCLFAWRRNPNLRAAPKCGLRHICNFVGDLNCVSGADKKKIDRSGGGYNAKNDVHAMSLRNCVVQTFLNNRVGFMPIIKSFRGTIRKCATGVWFRSARFSLLFGTMACLGTASALAETHTQEAPDRTMIGQSLAATMDRPASRNNALPRARWEHRRNGELWTRVALAAINTHGQPLLDVVPTDIADWCPSYPANKPQDRAAFWAALLSTLSRYESTWRPDAVGGGGQWFGLLQIYPPTAEFRNCRVQTGEALKHAPLNLNCAIRIMSVTVPRDNAISVKDGRWKGVAADWGPIRNDWMRRDMQRYTKRQVYCRDLAQVRPPKRP